MSGGVTDQGSGETAEQMLELIDMLIASEPVRRTEGKGVWAFDDEYLRDLRERTAALLACNARQKEALEWIQDFAARMSDRHTGFVHVERLARAALGDS